MFWIEALASSLAAKVQEQDNSCDNKVLLIENFSNINTAPELTYGKRVVLVHAVTQMRLAVFPSKLSNIDSDCVKPVLVLRGGVRGWGGESGVCEFFIVSRYNIHDDGDSVCRGYEVLLRLVTHPIFLHVTAPALRAKKGADTNALGQPLGENSCGNVSAFEGNLLPSVVTAPPDGR
ncbi:inositol 1,4,5-trisphosphate receptor [Trypanosoma rangeli]|uniref:Inositol 1,4,5-trisphosphate receptor n=1 Tax=Trypanosoma rangeli TaxID=5698 RepID=A0A3R7JW35_TRYRA|nr:inositol 1,4,5-trisphosphate receptor [Trypanosoma rangeli]RNE97750.1 inositol 1,4,5-trisphosphate receptor [Trypanosoma rangeli]|eukprot:RNE97750.1 inositol 1,4,5-trisphosphate receptor [Trypanosoma rangeli]